MEGMTGRLFREFSLVISGAVVISTFAALTITPMLATKLLVRQEKQSWFYNKTEPFFVWLNNFYSRTLAGFLRRRWIALPLVALMIGLIGWLWGKYPGRDGAAGGPFADYDQHPRIGGARPTNTCATIPRGINRLVDSLVPEARAVTARVSSGRGNVQIALKDIATRERTQMEIAEVVSAAVRTRTKARAFVQQQSTFGGRRGSMPVQYVLQATNIERLQEVLPEFMRKVYESPVFQMADVDLKFSKPEARIAINRDKANLLGVSTRNIAQTLQYGLSGQRLGYFYMNGKQYEILAEINRQQRNKPADLKSIYVRSDKGEMIQLDNLITLEENVAPPQLYHYNRFLSATVSAGLAKGKTIGQGLDEMDRIAEQTLGDDFRTALAGDSKEFRESSSSLIFAFLLAIVLIYLILAAQFESFKDPLVIMLTVPLAIAGALVFMAANGQTMNIFSQIGIIMLIGLVAKNGILIVEFANQKQDAGAEQAGGHRAGFAAAPAPDSDDQRFDHSGPAAADGGFGRGCAGTYRHGYRRGGRHGGFDAVDPLYRAGDLQLRIDRPDPKNEKRTRNETTDFNGSGCGGRRRGRGAGVRRADDPAAVSGTRTGAELRCPHHTQRAAH